MKTSAFAASAAMLALSTAQTAQAQQTCYSPDDLADAAVYMMPIAYDSAKSTCAKRLKADGFMARSGDKFIAPFRAKQAKAWPGAFRVMKKQLAGRSFSGMSGKDIVAMVSTMPTSAVRPLADGMIGQMIAGEIKPAQCGQIERGMELLSPLPPENIAQLFPLVADFASLSNFKLCTTNKK